MIPTLNEHASFIRQRIEKHHIELVEIGYKMFADFPEDCCDFSSIFLGSYLIEKKVCCSEDITVYFNNWDPTYEYGHTWLLVKGRWLIDITADQFDNIHSSIIVQEDSLFHKSFQDSETQSFEIFCRWNCRDKAKFESAWNLLRNK